MSERGKIVTLAALVLILVALGVYQFVIRKPRTPVKPAKSAAVEAEEASVEKTELPSEEDIDALNAWLNAPSVEGDAGRVAGRFGTPPPGDTSAGPNETVAVAGDDMPLASPPSLGGIMAVEGELKAIIGGRAYARGDAVPWSDYRIADITRNTVIFEDGNGRAVKVMLLQ